MNVEAYSKPYRSYTYWLKKNWYYHSYLAASYRFIIPSGSKVLQVGCKTGHIVAAVEPSYGVGIDQEELCIIEARQQYPQYHFHITDIENVSIQETFDYIILSSTIMETDDIQELFKGLRRFCHEGTKIIIDSYSWLWEPVLWLTQRIGWRRETTLRNWISLDDLENFLMLSGFEKIRFERKMLLPFYIPLVSWFFNIVIANIPLINRLCLIEWVIARPIPTQKNPQDYSVSVIIPCKNERGNIEQAVVRCPQMGKATELIFIDGHSHDNTFAEMRRIADHYSDKKITCVVQDGKGKGDAVRKGFALAQGDILMILDGDLTMPPEELPKFFDALMHGKGEFINGSRLIYGMESEAMRFLNLLANHGFGIIFSILLGQRIKDTLCGTKVLFKRDYETIVQHRSFFGEFDPFGDFDLLFGAAKQNLKIIDMPIHYKARTYGTSQIRRFYCGFLLLYMSWIGLKKFKLR